MEPFQTNEGSSSPRLRDELSSQFAVIFSKLFFFLKQIENKIIILYPLS